LFCDPWFRQVALDLHRPSRCLEDAMPTTAETLLEIARIAQAPVGGHPRLQAQAACVRALSDEITRHKSGSRRFAALCEQLQEELSNLAYILEDAAMPEPPASGIHFRE
jgi:hypothetical protein